MTTQAIGDTSALAVRARPGWIRGLELIPEFLYEVIHDGWSELCAEWSRTKFPDRRSRITSLSDIGQKQSQEQMHAQQVGGGHEGAAFQIADTKLPQISQVQPASSALGKVDPSSSRIPQKHRHSISSARGKVQPSSSAHGKVRAPSSRIPHKYRHSTSAAREKVPPPSAQDTEIPIAKVNARITAAMKLNSAELVSAGPVDAVLDDEEARLDIGDHAATPGKLTEGAVIAAALDAAVATTAVSTPTGRTVSELLDLGTALDALDAAIASTAVSTAIHRSISEPLNLGTALDTAIISTAVSTATHRSISEPLDLGTALDALDAAIISRHLAHQATPQVPLRTTQT